MPRSGKGSRPYNAYKPKEEPAQVYTPSSYQYGYQYANPFAPATPAYRYANPFAPAEPYRPPEQREARRGGIAKKQRTEPRPVLYPYGYGYQYANPFAPAPNYSYSQRYASTYGPGYSYANPFAPQPSPTGTRTFTPTGRQGAGSRAYDYYTTGAGAPEMQYSTYLPWIPAGNPLQPSGFPQYPNPYLSSLMGGYAPTGYGGGYGYPSYGYPSGGGGGGGGGTRAAYRSSPMPTRTVGVSRGQQYGAAPQKQPYLRYNRPVVSWNV